jgi:hypothetical protein
VTELTKELIVDSIAVTLTALFTGIPAVLLVWWTWRRDQERLLVQKLFPRWQTLQGKKWVAEKDSFGPVFGILIRNRSLFSVHVSEVGFEIDKEIISLEHPLFPMKMKMNPDLRSNMPYIADDESDPKEIPSLKSTHVSLHGTDRPKIAAALLAASERHKISVEELLNSPRVNALVALETGKQFTSRLPLIKRIKHKVIVWVS